MCAGAATLLVTRLPYSVFTGFATLASALYHDYRTDASHELDEVHRLAPFAALEKRPFQEAVTRGCGFYDDPATACRHTAFVAAPDGLNMRPL